MQSILRARGGGVIACCAYFVSSLALDAILWLRDVLESLHVCVYHSEFHSVGCNLASFCVGCACICMYRVCIGAHIEPHTEQLDFPIRSARF